MPESWRIRVVVAGLVLLGVALAPALYWCLFGWIPTVLPDEAKSQLREQSMSTVLVDVRAPERFAAGHIEGAVNWPLEEIIAVRAATDLPARFHRKRLLMLCDVGMASRLATHHLKSLSSSHAINVRGGIQEWTRSAPQPQGGQADRWLAAGVSQSLPFRQSPPIEQALAVISYFFVKPIYMLLSLVVAAALWKSTARDLVALRWGMISFFLGEAACAVNYFGYKEASYVWEYLHSAGMFVSFGFIVYAVLEALDWRVLGLSDPQRKCAAARLCGACIKHAEVPCGLQRLFLVLTPALIVVAAMAPTADWRDNSYNTLIFGQPYNYAHLRVFQQVENWYCPGAAVVLLGVSLLILLLKRHEPVRTAKIAFAAGCGLLGFGMLRMLLGAAYDQNRVWFLVWEETTEFLLILGVCCVLWIFRRGLFPGFDEWLRAGLVALGLPLEHAKPDAAEEAME